MTLQVTAPSPLRPASLSTHRSNTASTSRGHGVRCKAEGHDDSLDPQSSGLPPEGDIGSGKWKLALVTGEPRLGLCLPACLQFSPEVPTFPHVQLHLSKLGLSFARGPSVIDQGYTEAIRRLY